MALIGADGTVREGQTVALTSADHDLDSVAEEAAGGIGVAQFAGALKIFPGDLEGFFKQLGKRDGHARKTNSSRPRSILPALRRTPQAFDRDRI
jgi:hypothetical protein